MCHIRIESPSVRDLGPGWRQDCNFGWLVAERFSNFSFLFLYEMIPHEMHENDLEA